MAVLLLGNIPTVILLAIYAACREKFHKRGDLDKMNIKDLQKTCLPTPGRHVFQSLALGRFQRKWAESMRMRMTSAAPPSMAEASPKGRHSAVHRSAPSKDAEA